VGSRVQNLPVCLVKCAPEGSNAPLGSLTKVFDNRFCSQASRCLAGLGPTHAIGNNIEPYVVRQLKDIFVVAPDATDIREAKCPQHKRRRLLGVIFPFGRFSHGELQRLGADPSIP